MHEKWRINAVQSGGAAFGKLVMILSLDAFNKKWGGAFGIELNLQRRVAFALLLMLKRLHGTNAAKKSFGMARK